MLPRLTSRCYFKNAETDMVGCFPGCCTVNNVLHMEGVVGVLVAAVRNVWDCIFSLLKRLGGKKKDRDKASKRTMRAMRTTDK